MITSDKPDIVIMDEGNKRVHIFELTMPHIFTIEKGHESKSNKYKYLEFENNDYTVLTQAFKVGIRGHISKANKRGIHQIYKLCSTKNSFKFFKSTYRN